MDLVENEFVQTINPNEKTTLVWNKGLIMSQNKTAVNGSNLGAAGNKTQTRNRGVIFGGADRIITAGSQMVRNISLQ